jgi:glycosyltransferase involved in cell wall biosynthesis
VSHTNGKVPTNESRPIQAARRARRIFHLVESFNLGGSESQAIEVARRMNTDNYQVTVGCLRADGPHVSVLQQAKIPIAEFPPGGGVLTPGGCYQMLRLARFLRHGRFDVVQTHDLYSTLMGVPAAWLARVPVIISSRRDLASWWWYTPRNRKLLRYIQGLSSFVLANSLAVRDFLVKEDGFNADRIRVIRNGVDMDRYADLAPDRKKLFPTLNCENKLIIVVANMHVKTKGHTDLIESSRTICQQYPEVRFVLVGDGRERSGLERKVEELGLRRNFLFLGHRNDVPALLSCSDIAVLPSWAEGLPNVVLEYMAAGLPVVATRVGGIVEMIEDGVSGLLVPPHDPESLAQAILKLLRTPGLAKQLAVSGQRRVRAEYSFERVLLDLRTLYAEAFQRKQSRRQSVLS